VTSTPSGSASQAEGIPVTEFILAQTAYYLEEQGDVEAAALLIDAESLELTIWDEHANGRDYRAQLNVPGWIAKRISEDLAGRIESVLRLISARHDFDIYDLVIGAALPPVDKRWR
jgi:hypothetical protein